MAPFMGMLDATIVNIAFPDIARTFPGASPGDLSWIISAYNLVFAALLIPAGRAGPTSGVAGGCGPSAWSSSSFRRRLVSVLLRLRY
jgi:MFS family permease